MVLYAEPAVTGVFILWANVFALGILFMFELKMLSAVF